MKSFKQFTNEEWIGMDYPTNTTSDDLIFFKNPTYKEMQDYMRTIKEYDVAGFIHKGDAYVFNGSHDTVVDRMGIRGQNEIRWRATKKSGKIGYLAPSGGDSLEWMCETEKGRARAVKELATVYNHKSLNKFMSDPKISFENLYEAFKENRVPGEELNKLLKQYRITTSYV